MDYPMSGSGSRVQHRHGLPVELRRVVAQIAAWLSLLTAGLVFAGSLLSSDPQATERVIAPLIVSAIGFHQLRTGRYHTGVIILAGAGATVAQAAFFSPDTQIQAAAVTLVVIGMIWTMFLSRQRWWHLAGYSLFLVAAQLLWEWGKPTSLIMGSAISSVGAFLGAVIITGWLQRTLLRSEQRFRDLFDGSPAAVWEEDFSRAGAALEELRASGVTDVRAHLEDHPDALDRLIPLIEVVDVNEAALQLLEAETRDDLLGPLRVPEIRSARQVLVEQFAALWEGRRELEFEFQGDILTGELRDFLIRWTVRSDDLRHVLVVLTDITKRKEAERALQESRDAFERLATNAADVITRLRPHPEPRWEYVSPAVERMIGYGPQDFYADGYIMRRIAHPEDRARLADYMRHPETWDDALTIRLVSEDGKVLWAEMRMTPIYDEQGNVALIETITRDITERKEYQTRLEELIRSKDEFLASVSHELRTPLTAVVGFAQELRDNRDAFGRDETAELIDMIAGESQEVADIVNDLLVAARADIGKVAIYPEQLDLAAEVTNVLGALGEGDRARVRVIASPAACVADPTRVRQIVRNLLTNALRYGGDRIEIETTYRSGHAVIEVRDNGAGIPAEEVERIFDPYYHGQTDTNQPASVGLGLTVSRRLAQLMGGNVTYCQRDGSSVFELMLPATGGNDRELSPAKATA
jgi:PAS domain S-box-containing protein